MAWRGLHLTQAARLSLVDSQICVKQDAGEVRLALEDIAWIVIDTPQATLSSALMAACMEAGIALVFTDERHTPSGLALPFHRHLSWGRLFADFVRDDDNDRRNKMLNYGYAVMRAGVARGLVASGILPTFGLKHDGATNAFNLADDLVEPFRPFVDVLAWKTFGGCADKKGDLTLEDRRVMAGVLLLNSKVGSGKVSLLVAAEMAAAGAYDRLTKRRGFPTDFPW